jgi:hypothetical protein
LLQRRGGRRGRRLRCGVGGRQSLADAGGIQRGDQILTQSLQCANHRLPPSKGQF